MCVVDAKPSGNLVFADPLVERLYGDLKSLKSQYDLSLDLSGGDFFLMGTNSVEILQEFVELIGEEKVSISATSIGYVYAIEKLKAIKLLNRVRKLLSIDTLDPQKDEWRDLVSIKNANFIREYVNRLLDPTLIYVGTILHVFSTYIHNLAEIHDLLQQHEIGN